MNVKQSGENVIRGARRWSRRQLHLRRRRLEKAFEQLEARRVLAAELASLEEMAALLSPHPSSIQGVTVVTHGFQYRADDGDSLMPLASAEHSRTDAENGSVYSSWLLDYDVRAEGTQSGFYLDLTEGDDGLKNGSRLLGNPSELVVLFDLASRSPFGDTVLPVPEQEGAEAVWFFPCCWLLQSAWSPPA